MNTLSSLSDADVNVLCMNYFSVEKDFSRARKHGNFPDLARVLKVLSEYSVDCGVDECGTWLIGIHFVDHSLDVDVEWDIDYPLLQQDRKTKEELLKFACEK